MSTAYPWREAKCWMMASAEFTKDELSERVEEYGRGFRDHIGEGKVYVNFSSGDEDLREMYGGEERLERLRTLKAKWDPEGRFSFYNPVA